MTLVYLSPVPWDSYEQRPHYFVRDFLSRGGRSAIWVNPYASRLPGWRDLTRSDWRQPMPTLERPAGLRVLDIGGWPVDPLPGGRRLNERLFWKDVLTRLRSELTARTTILGIGRPTAFASAAVRTLETAGSFYDAMDDFPEFYRGRSRTSTRKIEQDIAAGVRLVVATTTPLMRKFSALHSRVLQLRNAFDMSLLPPYEAQPRGPAHFGFIGCLGGWFDWNVTTRLAEKVHPAPVTLIGPTASRVPMGLPGNVKLHPPCSQTEGAKWVQQFTAGLIPFTIDALTGGVDPIKYYQYRAAGLPVLSTRFGEMATRGAADGVFFLDSEHDMAQVVADASTFRASEAEIADFREANTWTARFRETRFWDSTTG
jgi:hypothetical protein